MPYKLFRQNSLAAIAAASLAFALPPSAFAQVVTFEELSLGTPGDGSTSYGGPGGGYFWNGSNGAGQFSTGGATFGNYYDTMWGSWEGFAYSNTSNSSTSGFGNQYSAVAGSGFGGSSNYVVGFNTFVSEWRISYASPLDLVGGGFYATNTTYAYNIMAGLDPFPSGAKKFGGTSGDDSDYFVLSITGWLGGSSTGTVDFYLADFRFEDNSQDYIIDDWTFVDLSALGTVDKLTFDLTSSDNHPTYGMNTPGYVAIDNVSTVPEPTALALIPSALLALGIRRKRSRRTLP